MTTALYYVVYMTGLTLLSLLLGSFFRNRLWTLSGLKVGTGNREDVPPPTAHVAGVDSAQAALGAAVFFWARIAFLLAYLLGIRYLRTVFWAIGLVGLLIIGNAMF